MKPCQGKFRQATWPKKKRLRIKWNATRDNLSRPNCDSDGKADNKWQAFSKHRLEVLGSLSNYDDHNDDFKKQ